MIFYFLQWNANGFYNKYEEFRHIVMLYAPLIILIQETHLALNESLKLNGYTPYFTSVSGDRRKGGVANLGQK